MEKFNQNLEKNPEEKVLDFANLNHEQVQNLKDEIRSHDGLVRVFIHADWYTDEYEKRIKYPIMRLLRSKNSPPVFFFEDVRYFEDVKKLFEIFDGDEGFLAKPVYLVKTMQRLPYPIMDGVPLPKTETSDSSISDESVEYGYQSLSRFFIVLHVLGVKKILVGGNELIIDDTNDVNKCVGNFIKVLDSLREVGEREVDFPKIDYKVSEMTGPKNRSDLRGLRNDLL
ncbi:MAG: hypothetical protein WCO12_03755 [bacterium]